MSAGHFAHLSDPHLTSLVGVEHRALFNKRLLGYLSWRRRRRDEHRAEVLDALRRDLNRDALSQIVVTGDLTHVGLPGECREALRWLRALAPPQQVALVPGNHDTYVAADWAETLGQWSQYLRGDEAAADNDPFPSLRVRGALAFIGLSSACPKPPLLATGTVAAAQLARLPALLDEAGQRGLFRVLCIHHCPLPGVDAWRKRLTNADEVQALVRRHGAELLLHGHGHRSQWHEMELQNGRRIPVVGVASASARGAHGEAAAYNLFDVHARAGGWTLNAESRRFDPDGGRFTRRATQTLYINR